MPSPEQYIRNMPNYVTFSIYCAGQNIFKDPQSLTNALNENGLETDCMGHGVTRLEASLLLNWKSKVVFEAARLESGASTCCMSLSKLPRTNGLVPSSPGVQVDWTMSVI